MHVASRAEALLLLELLQAQATLVLVDFARAGAELQHQ